MKKLFLLILALVIIIIPAHAQTTQHTVTLTWTASSDSTTTNPGTASVYRATGSCPKSGIPAGATLLTAAAPPAGPYVDSTVVAGSTYCYYVTATISGVTSGPSNTTQATVGLFPPTGLTSVVY